MPKEAEIRKKALKKLTNKNWICWFPPKTRYHHTDILGIADLICIKGKQIKFIQLTTISNLSTRKRKIEKFLAKNKLKIPTDVWGYSKKNKKFKIIKIC